MAPFALDLSCSLGRLGLAILVGDMPDHQRRGHQQSCKHKTGGEQDVFIAYNYYEIL